MIPVDTHVYQIAIKHYGLRGSTNAKQTINPRLYDEVNKKLSSKWGDYAGWAHSVGDFHKLSVSSLTESLPAGALYCGSEVVLLVWPSFSWLAITVDEVGHRKPTGESTTFPAPYTIPFPSQTEADSNSRCRLIKDIDV